MLLLGVVIIMRRVFTSFLMQKFLTLLLATCFCVHAASDLRAADENVQTFEALKGWWLGFGRLGFKNGETENVKCRATYHLEKADATEMRQMLRCASASGAVEIESSVKRDGNLLSGMWSEKKHELSGQVAGQFVPDGFRVNVTGRHLTAEMTINVHADKHIVEIRFFESSLFALSMMFSRSNADP